ncbi:Kif1c [Symbiodinium natans]|uniref:Kinesin-like protein n=1 Tax=Symbiodinium natans TaxID=878477 RepID=A0A812NEH6_9DINO|nr:Kif1c [Symbiodinium natans]
MTMGILWARQFLWCSASSGGMRLDCDGSRESTNAKINLVDLAGSERHKSSDFQGHTFKEGCAINQSLSALALVIKELGEQQQSRVMRQRSRSMSIDKSAGLGPSTPAAGALLECKEVVPFRSSKLTFLLRDSLAGNTRSRMVACVSPAAINADETISTCRFAASVKKVRTNACVNVDRKKGVVQHLQAEIRRLKKLLAARGVEVGALGAGSVQEEIADRERVLKTLKQSYQVQVEEARLGKWPATLAVKIRDYLALPERLTLACASRHANMLCGDEEAWGQYATTLWAALWKSAGTLPDGNCGCRFSSPQEVQSVDPKMKVLGLWHLQSLTTLEIDVRTTTREYRRLTVEPHATVAHVKKLLEHQTGFAKDHCELIVRHTGKTLSHQEAPVAAYLWLSFCRSSSAWRRPPILEMTIKLFPWCSEARMLDASS